MQQSRRQFLHSSLGVPLAAALGYPGGRILGDLPQPPTHGWFKKPQIIRYDADCFTINNLDAFVFGAEFHYPRCPRQLWRDRFLKLQRANFNTVETMVFWNYHEREEGHFDFADLEDFIKLAKAMRFWLIVRPGPYICAEFERGGFPPWVVAKRFPLRSMHPENLKASQYWYDHVLPVIRANQITQGGPIIMMQLENEYDFWKLPEPEQREYIRFLAHLAWDAGIEVPLFTNWTRVVRDPADPDMARILDTCDFYPRWNFLKEVPPALEKLRREEPDSPLGVTELQGGWFSQFGGKLSEDQEGVDGAQLNALTKTVLELGVTYFNYYMGYGGTNFDWAAKTLTTSYDYAAPVREPGGLWEKYYRARGIGVFLSMFGNVLTRAHLLEGAGHSTNPDVSVAERVNGQSAVLFVRAGMDARQHFQMTFRDPASPSQRVITVPREGELVIGARGMKMLPVQVPISGGQLRYTTAEVLAHGVNLDRHFLLIYDDPGRAVEIALAAKEEPHIEGDFLYQYWDKDQQSAIIGLRIEKGEKFLLVDNHLIGAIPLERALRTWVGEFPSKVIPGVKEANAMSVPFITDAYLLAATGSEGKRIWADLDFLPGDHDVSVLLPSKPTQCRVDGVVRDCHYDPQWRIAHLQIIITPSRYRAIELKEMHTWVEGFDSNSGRWLATPARPLEELGPIPYGYVKYRAQFSYASQPKMYVSTYADDNKKVFLNGKLVAEAANPQKWVEVSPSNYLQSGTNTLEIAYELFGSPNGDDNMGELKGIEYVRLGRDPQDRGLAIDPWQIQTFPAPMRGRDVDPEFSPGGWKAASLVETSSEKGLVPAFTWCRAEFPLEKPAEGWSVPWRLVFEAQRDALLYLNGKFVGRYVTTGPQTEFYLPEPYLLFGGKKNLLTVVLAYADHPGHIRTLRVEPYEEYSTRRTRLEFEW
jgi:hypothetical protein